MDPKALKGLDPKLQETYARVMGTQAQPVQTTPQPSPQKIENSISPGVQPVDMPQTQESSPLSPPITPAEPFQPLPSPTSVNQAAHSQDASPLLRILYLGGAVVFFLVYTFFWIKVFRLSFPF